MQSSGEFTPAVIGENGEKEERVRYINNKPNRRPSNLRFYKNETTIRPFDTNQEYWINSQCCWRCSVTAEETLRNAGDI